MELVEVVSEVDEVEVDDVVESESSRLVDEDEVEVELVEVDVVSDVEVDDVELVEVELVEVVSEVEVELVDVLDDGATGSANPGKSSQGPIFGVEASRNRPLISSVTLELVAASPASCILLELAVRIASMERKSNGNSLFGSAGESRKAKPISAGTNVVNESPPGIAPPLASAALKLPPTVPTT